MFVLGCIPSFSSHLREICEEKGLDVPESSDVNPTPEQARGYEEVLREAYQKMGKPLPPTATHAGVQRESERLVREAKGWGI